MLRLARYRINCSTTRTLLHALTAMLLVLISPQSSVRAEGSSPGSGFGVLTVHYEVTDVTTGQESNSVQRRTLDASAVIDALDNNSSYGRKHERIFRYEEGSLEGPTNNAQSRLVSLKGNASISRSHNSVEPCGTVNGKRSRKDSDDGLGGIPAEGTSFFISFDDDAIQAFSFDSGGFEVSGHSAFGPCSEGGSGARNDDHSHGGDSVTFNFSAEMEGKNPAWSVRKIRTAAGYLIEAQYHEITVGKMTPGSSEDTKKLAIRFDFAPGKDGLKYGPTKLDIAELKYPGEAVDSHVFMMKENKETKKVDSWLPHANFQGEVLVDGVNKVRINTDPTADRDHRVTSEYKILRKVRHWYLDAAGKPLKSPITIWLDDNTNPIEDWIDNPGCTSTPYAPPGWRPFRMMDEFLVGVQDKPDFGFFYVAFVMEMKKNAYRIKYSTPQQIDQKKFADIYSSDAPSFTYPFVSADEGWIQLEYKDGKWGKKP